MGFRNYVAGLCGDEKFRPKSTFNARNKDIVIETYQVWILAPDIGQCPAKNLVMSDESCFTTDLIFSLGVKYFFYNLTERLKCHKHSITLALSCSGFFMNILIDNLFMKFSTFKPMRCVWVKGFYTITSLFFAALLTASPLKKCYSHNIALILLANKH